jgi:transcriptional regulator with XRE-family HTH domain
MNNSNAIERLIRAGVTRGQIAAYVGCTRAAVSHWEAGRSIPSRPKLDALVKLATERGVVLLASDFGQAKQEAA